MVGFMYVMSLGFYVADELILTPAGIDARAVNGTSITPREFNDERIAPGMEAIHRDSLRPASQDGSLFDRVLNFSQGGFSAVWTLLTLLTGTYFLDFLRFFAIPDVLVAVFQAIFAIVSARTVIYYVLGR